MGIKNSANGVLVNGELLDNLARVMDNNERRWERRKSVEHKHTKGKWYHITQREEHDSKIYYVQGVDLPISGIKVSGWIAGLRFLNSLPENFGE